MVDTLKVLSNFTDIIVLRHSQATSPLLSQSVEVPIINAGDGPNEHPTQALSDLYCIKKELGKLRGLTVTLLGDLRVCIFLIN
jgi:aspartate carbamoyltransferase catalytic subunit